MTKTKAPIELNKLPKKEQKIVIARDIIAQVKANKYIANPDQYVSNVRHKKQGWVVPCSNMSFNDVKEEWNNIEECEVCMIGACIMSITQYKNKLRFRDLPTGINQITDDGLMLLKSVFSSKELTMIEVMFEGYYHNYTDNMGRDKMNATITTAQAEACKTFYKKYAKDADKRMIAICNHIIKHGTVKLI